jgi:hypothetical protein
MTPMFLSTGLLKGWSPSSLASIYNSATGSIGSTGDLLLEDESIAPALPLMLLFYPDLIDMKAKLVMGKQGKQLLLLPSH